MRISGRLRAAPRAAANAAVAARTIVAVRRKLRAGAPIDDLLRSLAPHRHGSARTPGAAEAAVRRAAALLPGTTCVPRAIAMADLLTPSDRHLVVVLGTRRDASGRWAAHAWVELDGEPWLAGPSAYQRLASYDGRDGWALSPDVGDGGAAAPDAGTSVS